MAYSASSTVRHTQLVKDIVQVVLHGLLADEHLLSHFLVLVALGDQLHDLALALAQRRPLASLASAATAGKIAGGGELPHDRRRGVRIQPDLAAMNLADAFDDQFGRGLLEHDTGAAELHGLHEFVLVFGSREDDDAGALVGLL